MGLRKGTVLRYGGKLNAGPNTHSALGCFCVESECVVVYIASYIWKKPTSRGAQVRYMFQIDFWLYKNVKEHSRSLFV